PGTLNEKIDPYLRPLYDALHDMMDPEAIPKLTAAGVIEVAPLAYMRGRAQPLHTKVLTPAGFRPIGEIAVGDEVIGSDGRPTEVLGVYPQGFKEIYRVTTQDGSSTLASGDHLWSVYTRDDRRRGKPPRVLQTKEMIGNLRAAHHHRYELPLLSAPVEFPARPVPADPYTVGLSLGEHGAQVPDDYLLNESAVRLSVLQGMLDAAAGPITQAGRSCRVQYPTASKQVRADVLFLVHSLGGIVNVRTRSTVRRATGERRESYVLDIRLPEGIEPFRREQKAARYAAHGGGRPMRFIHSIEEAG